MLLAVDVGNTNTVVGLFDTGAGGHDDLVDQWRLASDRNRTSDEWLLAIRGLLDTRSSTMDHVDGFVVASVVPKVTLSLTRMCERLRLDPLVVDWRSVDMEIALDDPSEIGPDRIANAVAVRSHSKGPVVVVDMGTATTFDVVSAEGVYEGGVIMPGLDISLEALFDRAAALRRIDLDVTADVIGKSTAGALRSGARHGYAAQIDGLCARIEAEIGRAEVVATGGLSSSVAPYSKRIDRYDPWLTLRGLQTIHQRSGVDRRRNT